MLSIALLAKNSQKKAISNLTELSAPSPSRGLKRPWFWACVFGLITFDLWSKAAVFSSLGLGGGARPIWGDWLSFFCLTNAGGIWGLGNEGGFTTLLTLVRLAAVGLLVVFVRRQPDENKMGLLTLALLIAGAVGNLYDNLSAWMPWDLDDPGKVRDFVMVRFVEPGWWPHALPWPLDPFPIFNFADACISVGFLLLITGLAKLRLQAEGKEEKE